MRQLGCFGEAASMDLIERGFAVTALTSFFVLIGVLVWVIA